MAALERTSSAGSFGIRHVPWIVMALVGAFSLWVVAVSRGEAINALWIVVAAVCCFLVAYRYYALYIARHVMRLDPSRPTPAVYRRRRPERTLLYRLVQAHLATWLARHD